MARSNTALYASLFLQLLLFCEGKLRGENGRIRKLAHHGGMAGGMSGGGGMSGSGMMGGGAGGARTFVGLWESIDTFDGSVAQYSIQNCNREGECDVRSNDSFRSDSPGLPCEPGGRFFAYGTGFIQEGGDVMLLPDYKLVCAIDPDNIKTQNESLVYNRREGTLTVVVEGGSFRFEDVLFKISD